MKYHIYTFNQNTVLKQSKGRNGDLKPEVSLNVFVYTNRYLKDFEVFTKIVFVSQVLLLQHGLW